MMTQADCEKVLRAMSSAEQALFLCTLGHTLTIVGREAYEFQGPEVTSPKLLRALNEVHHRIYSQTRSLLAGGTQAFAADTLASWLAAEERSPELQSAFLWAFEESLKRSRI
jgi:hypothetical protein